MKAITYIMILALMLVSHTLYSQTKKSDANIIGHVTHKGEHLKFANIMVKGTTIGAATDETGHYQLINLPVGKITIRAQMLGYKPEEKTVVLEANKTMELKFELERDVLGIEEVVVTSDRNATNKKEASTIVNILTAKTFETTQSVTLCEGLNFTSGVRTENNCQNCGFTQVRMNGLEGAYSQILINSRPIFSGLAGVYGLELIPSNMIERVEIIRGGGSALYGSNAIAGTINLILKDPIYDTYEFGVNREIIGVGLENSGTPANDDIVNFNTSIVSSDHKTGMAMYGFYRNRKEFDANNDSFSEIPLLKNTTIGARLFHRFGIKDKLALDFFHISEERRGGNKFDFANHEADISEALKHNITTGALTYEHFFRDIDLLSFFASGQKVNRDSYYGAEQSLRDYGKTNDFSYTVGAQYNAYFENSNLVFGIENQGAWLKDVKLGYLDIDNAIVVDSLIVSIPHTDNTTVADQITNTVGAFAQYEIRWNKLKVSLGGRFDHYNIEDKEYPYSKVEGNVFSPRINLLYDVQNYLQARVSYSQGYRAPQIFDEDLHIETSGSRKVIHRNDPNLSQETSHSYMASLDFNKQIGSIYLGFLAEGFYTKLQNPFVNEYSSSNQDGTVIYTRTNSEKGAVIKGINLELNVVPNLDFSFNSGFTLQTSEYEEQQEFNETKFFRTPDSYGYFTIDWKPINKFGISATGNYTGKMLVPYFGMQIANPDDGELRESNSFFDLGMKVRYNVKLNGASIQFYTGVKNIFNSYQNDFDSGIDRDPGYVYGPMLPRTVYLGFKVGNMID